MSWTYTGRPGEEPRDLVRFLIGDTDESDALLSDEEIQFALAREKGAAYAASAFLADALSARFARRETVKVEGFSLEGGERTAEAFRVLAARLRVQAVEADAVQPDATPPLLAPVNASSLLLTGSRRSELVAGSLDPDRLPAIRREDPSRDCYDHRLFWTDV